MNQPIKGFHLDPTTTGSPSWRAVTFSMFDTSRRGFSGLGSSAEEGRASMLGKLLDCKKCESGAPPDLR